MPAVTPDVFLYVAAGLFGAMIGSFLNVCIHRLPRHESIIWPPSRCPACSGRIAPYDNIPILGFLWLWGRCRLCRAPISFRYGYPDNKSHGHIVVTHKPGVVGATP